MKQSKSTCDDGSNPAGDDGFAGQYWVGVVGRRPASTVDSAEVSCKFIIRVGLEDCSGKYYLTGNKDYVYAKRVRDSKYFSSILPRRARHEHRAHRS